MYIGNTVITQGFVPQIDYFNGNGSTTSFTLSRPVASVAQLLVHVANVTQNPSSAFTVTGNTITFASAPPSGTNNIWVEYTSLITQTIVPTNTYQVSGPVYTGVSAPLGGATNPITGSTGSANNYIQTYIYNTFNGANSSADFTAYASNGTDASGWVDMGVTSPSFSQAAYSVTGPNETYLFGSAPSGSGTSGNLVIATDSTGTTNAIQFYTGGFTKAKSAFTLMLDQNGNIGQGVTPSAWSVVSPAMQVGSGGAFLAGQGSFAWVGVGTNAYYNGSNWVYKTSSYASTYIQNAGAHTWNIAPSGTAGNAISFTSAMTLDNSGNLLVGTTTAYGSGGCLSGVTNNFGTGTVNAKAVVWGQYSSNNSTVQYAGNWGSTNSWGIGPHSSSNDSTLRIGVASITTSGVSFTGGYANIYAGAYTNASDYRIKENVTNVSDGTLQKILALRVVNYNIIRQADEEGKMPPVKDEVGFIAHEIQNQFPILVSGEKDAVSGAGVPQHQGVDYAKLTAYLTKAIQELSAQVTALQAKVA